MPQTPVTSATPYASPSDFINRVDVNFLGLMVRDDDTQATPTDLLSDPKLLVALLGSSGMVEAACLRAERYSAIDLNTLITVGGASAELLKDIVCGLAIQRLRWRRGLMEAMTYPLAQQAVMWLQALSDGEMIFSFAETVQAGLPATSRDTAQNMFYDTPTLLTNNVRMWGIRANRRCGPYGYFGGGYGAF